MSSVDKQSVITRLKIIKLLIKLMICPEFFWKQGINYLSILVLQPDRIAMVFEEYTQFGQHSHFPPPHLKDLCQGALRTDALLQRIIQTLP